MHMTLANEAGGAITIETVCVCKYSYWQERLRLAGFSHDLVLP